ncbi:MAG: archaemetzincin family Zn-dependent metalloprotease [Syntrophaceae bacterium]|nr:archaemetzincin family Zn-dependent metalloprotease [Syntrophaceae bacterium]
MDYVYIVPVGSIRDDFWVEPLEHAVMRTFGLKTRYRRFDLDLARAYDARRGQYDSAEILRQLIAALPPDGCRVLGVADVDLFIPILTFVFGEAQLNGAGSVASLHRLHNEYYGLPRDKHLMLERLLKEALHELGHTFGLIHCHDPRCVLRSSTYVEDIDQKSAEFCEACREKVRAGVAACRRQARSAAGKTNRGNAVRSYDVPPIV